MAFSQFLNFTVLFDIHACYHSWWIFISSFSMNLYLECYDSHIFVCAKLQCFYLMLFILLLCFHFFMRLWFFVWFILQFLRNLHLPKNRWMIKYLVYTQTNYLYGFLITKYLRTYLATSIHIMYMQKLYSIFTLAYVLVMLILVMENSEEGYKVGKNLTY